jgi:hypothetical protein
MAGARKRYEAIGRGDEIDRAFGYRAPDLIVGIAPDIECG